MNAENSKVLGTILGKVQDALLKILNHAEDVYYNKKCIGKLYSEKVWMDLQKTTGTCRADLDFNFYSSIVGACRGLKVRRKIIKVRRNCFW